MYDPTIGRFLSEDPLGFDADDPNLHRYVKNSPTNYTDPTGMFPEAPGAVDPRYDSLDEEYDALGGPTYTESDFEKLWTGRVELGRKLLALANDGRCQTLGEIAKRVTVLADAAGYRSANLKTKPAFYQRAVEDLESSGIITASSYIIFAGNWAYSGLHGLVEFWPFYVDEGDNGPGDCFLQMEIQRNNLLISRLEVISKRIKEIRALRPDLPTP
jgi:hypothetical protein